MKKQVYSFPLLKHDEIVSCIREMNIPITDDDLKKANVQTVRRVFELFIEIILGITKEDMSQPAFSGLNVLNYPELHEESIPEIAFFRAS